MSKMKHLLRKLHIGGNVNEHHRLGESRPAGNSSPSPSPSPSQSSSSSVPLESSSSSVPSVSSSTPPTLARNRVVDASERTSGAISTVPSLDSSGDFNFLEEEFQVQLALAISASDPDAHEDPESVQIKAAKRMSLGCPPSVVSDKSLVEFLSLQYWNYNVVNYDEKVMDGFYDVYGLASNSNMQGKMPLLVDLQATSISDHVDYEVILVNRNTDPALQQLESKAVSIALECQASELDPVSSGLVQKIADLVVDCMGGPVSDADEMLRRWTVRNYELRNSLNTIILPLGCLDVGLSRHRALLFKVLADRINLACRLVKGSYYTGTDDGAVNLIKINYESEYIIDLMGAPGMLIPAEIPSFHFQNSGLDVVSSDNIAQIVKDSYSALDEVNCHLETKPGTFGERSPDSDHVSQAGGSGSDAASQIGIIQAMGDNVNLVEKNQTERFEYEFGKLLPSLHRSHESSSGASGKASSAQKMKVKDVSKYVISAAQNPEFAQKLHAVLLESGASPPPDLFSDINPHSLDEHNMLAQRNFDNGAQLHLDMSSSSSLSFGGMESLSHVACEYKQQHSAEEMAEKRKESANDFPNLGFEKLTLNSSTDERGSGSSDHHCVTDTNVINCDHCLPSADTGEGFVLVNNGANELTQDDSMGVGMVPVFNSSIAITRISYGEQIQKSSVPCAVDTCHKQLENVSPGGDGGTIANNVEIGGNMCLHEHQQSAKGSMEKFMETANNNPRVSSCVHSEKINPMLDEVAEYEIPWEDLQIGERIGLGSYGEVYRADWNGTEVAVKKFLDQDFSGDALDQFRCEVRIMQRLRHPNVVLFMGAVTRPPHLSILTEYLPRGSLYRLLHRPNVHLDEKRRLRMALDVAKGMNYLHTSHPTIVHRDLKSPNLLVDKNWVVKVCDFGLSRLKHHTFLSSKSTAGTPEWMAPEVLRNEPSNEKCDVYSFGVILWELATLRMPWSGMNPMQVVGAVGFQNRRLDIPEELDPVVGQIIYDCWQSDPSLRPPFSHLMSRLKHLQRLVVEKA